MFCIWISASWISCSVLIVIAVERFKMIVGHGTGLAEDSLSVNIVEDFAVLCDEFGFTVVAVDGFKVFDSIAVINPAVSAAVVFFCDGAVEGYNFVITLTACVLS